MVCHRVTLPNYIITNYYGTSSGPLPVSDMTSGVMYARGVVTRITPRDGLYSRGRMVEAGVPGGAPLAMNIHSKLAYATSDLYL